MATRMASSTATATLTKQASANQAITSRAAYHSTTSTTQSSSQQIPNRFTQAFQEMKEVCPNSIYQYMHPVYLKQNDQDNLYHNIHVPKNLDK